MRNLVFVVSAASLLLAETGVWGQDVQFQRDIRPILSNSCFQCHGPDAHDREADLRLDVRAGVFDAADDRRIIAPGSPEKSLLFARITSSDEELRMPPPSSGKSLDPAQIERIRRWIEQGAAWQSHWSFVPPRRPTPPAVQNKAWVRNAIDAFVLARLEASGLRPAPEADRRTLIRRVTLDLTGLPPTRAQLRSCLSDTRPNAYERLVDSLLESAQYGEHQARFWLDAARYGDTHGLHLDNYREIWPYRDWVIKSFNQNRPFDQFTIAQLAGDLLPQAELDQLVATGFIRCHVTTNEGGTIPEEFYVRNVVDRVETVGTVFLGLTLGCAVCHEHKFDPLSQAEFYQLFAFFNSLDGAPLDGNVKDHHPVVKVPTVEQTAELQRLDGRLTALLQQRETRLAQLEPDFQDWLRRQQRLGRADRAARLRSPDKGLVAQFSFDQSQGTAIGNSIDDQPQGRALAEPNWVAGRFGGGYQFDEQNAIDLGRAFNFQHDQAFSLGGWVWAPPAVTAAVISKTDVKALRRGYELTVDRGVVQFHLVAKWQSYAIDVQTVERALEPGRWHHVFVTYDGSGQAAGIAIYVDGARCNVDIKTDSIKTGKSKRSITSNKPLLLGRRGEEAAFVGGRIDEILIYERRLSELEVIQLALADQVSELLSRPADRWTARQRDVLRRYFAHSHDALLTDLVSQCEHIRQQQTAVIDGAPTTLVFRELPAPREAFRLERGHYTRPAEAVQRATPAILPPLPENLPRDRWGLAQWLVSDEHPLTSRVTVNRFWQQVFGVGLVKTAEDFGSQGEPPSHPQLLDWLAVEFREHGWNVKRLMKQLVMSATYRQSSRTTRLAYERDPQNRLLARGPAYRLDAEMLRDQALALSGLLVPQLGGPSVKPPQPDGIWFAVGYSGSDTVRFTKDTGADKVYRRSLFTFWKRTAPPPQMSTFDAPSREACVVRRERTNTPLQALLLLNDPQYFEAARFLAARTLRHGGQTTGQRARLMFELATARLPTAAELTAILSAHADHLRRFKQDRSSAAQLVSVGETPSDKSLDTADLAAWTMIANLVLNLDEVITKN